MRLEHLFALASLVAAPALRAQRYPQTRDGFTISFGIGSGSSGTTCDGCTTDRQTAPTIYLRLGGAVRPDLIIAGEINSWDKQENGSRFSISTFNAVAQWYPQQRNGFYLIGGLGLGALHVEVPANIGTLTNDGSGFGYQVGAGYDIRLARNFSLTPYVNYFATSGVQFQHGGGSADGNVLHFGLGFTWH